MTDATRPATAMADAPLAAGHGRGAGAVPGGRWHRLSAVADDPLMVARAGAGCGRDGRAGGEGRGLAVVAGAAGGPAGPPRRAGVPEPRVVGVDLGCGYRCVAGDAAEAVDG